MRPFFFTALCIAAISSAAHAEPLAGKRPNILFILTDDQGYGDVSAHGNPVLKTPNYDRLRTQSRRFTDFMVSPTCSPTRSALMTGRHEFRNGITHTILERERLVPGAITLAEVLKSAGYTTGIFGKWHLGDEDAYQPGSRGFDEVFIHGAGGIGQTYPGSCGDAPGNTYYHPAILHNGTFEKSELYCTDAFFAQATKWIDSQKGKKPFLCWLATNAPHGPYNAKPEDAALYADKTPNADVANFFGMIHNIDENIGRLLAKLDEWGIAKDTLVVLMNDNGGTAGTRVYNAGMHGMKGTPWLGGTRAMSFWRWPGKIEPGDCGALAAHVDIFRTMAELTGAKLSAAAEKQAEGRSLVPLLENPSVLWEDRLLFTHVGRWQKFADPNASEYRNCAVRNSQYTLVSEAPRAGRQGGESAGGTANWQLFDIKADPGQEKNIAADKPEVVKQLSDAYEKWWASLKGQVDVNEQVLGPKLNPFAERYWKQFGGGPTPADYERMDPEKARTFEAGRAKGKARE